MTATTFNTLQYAKQLKAADMPEHQAEIAAEVLGKALEERDKALAAVEAKVQELAADTKRNAAQMATKEDIIKLEAKIDKVEARLEAKIDKVEAKIELSHKDLLIKLGGIIGAAVTVMLAAMRWMPHS